MYKKKSIDVKNIEIKDFQGVSINEIANVEECLSVNIDILKLMKTKQPKLYINHQHYLTITCTLMFLKIIYRILPI